MKRLIVFDLDGTLAESKSAIDTEMAGLLLGLLGVAKVAVISGGDWPQFEKQIVGNLPDDARLDGMSLLPTCGAKFYSRDGGWKQRYADNLTAEEKAGIIAALQQALDASGFAPPRHWGEVIEDRGAQITLSALGQDAPLAEKSKWDPDFHKRQAIQATLAETLPDFSVRLGGASSIDVTKPGIDKAYGVRKLAEILGIPTTDMIFIGDALFPGGNDHAATTTGAACIGVANPHETKRVIEAIIACLTAPAKAIDPKGLNGAV